MTETTLADRALVRLSGEDVRGFLQGLVTNDVTGALPVWAGLLTAQGKVLFDFLVWDDPQGGSDDLLIDCEAEQADALVRRLSLYRLRRAITIAIDSALAVHWSTEDGAGVADPRLAALGFRWLAPADAPALGWRAHRLGLGVTEGIAELGSDKTLWLETNAIELNGVSFSKGCYVGQENTARMNWRQKVNRRLVVLHAAENPGESANVYYADLGMAVQRIAVDSVISGPEAVKAGSPIVPDWLAQAVSPKAEM
jgi:hypothetical protein